MVTITMLEDTQRGKQPGGFVGGQIPPGMRKPPRKAVKQWFLEDGKTVEKAVTEETHASRRDLEYLPIWL